MLIDVLHVNHPILPRALGRILRRELRGLTPETKLAVAREALGRRNELMPLLRAGREIKKAWPKTTARVELDFDQFDVLRRNRTRRTPPKSSSQGRYTWARLEAEVVERAGLGDQSIFVMNLSFPDDRHRSSWLGKVRRVADRQDCHTDWTHHLDSATIDLSVRPKWRVSR